MVAKSLDKVELTQVWPNLMSMLILATLAVALLVSAPWGRDPTYQVLSHFFTLFPLVVLALITYITQQKLAQEEQEVVRWEVTRGD